MRKKRHTFFLVFLLMGLLLVSRPALAKARGRIQATVTAYTSSRHSITASGRRVFEGVVACPRKYPFGTRFRIEGRVYDCEDRLNRRFADRFDLWKPTKAEARAFGKRKLVIALLKPTRSG